MSKYLGLIFGLMFALVGCGSGTQAWQYRDIFVITRPGEAYAFKMRVPNGKQSEVIDVMEVNGATIGVDNITYDAFRKFAKETGESVDVEIGERDQIKSVRTPTCGLRISEEETELWGNVDVVLHLRSGQSIKLPATTAEIHKKLGKPEKIENLYSRQP